MPIDNNSLEVRSAEMEEIVGIIPHWITRWGLTSLFAIAIIGFSVSCFISYPDSLHADVLIQAINQPGKVTISRTDSEQIFDFRVKNGDIVNPGDTLLTHLNKRNGKVYFTITPMSGKIFISDGIGEADILNKIIWVVPKSDKVEIKIKFSNKGSGAVKIGQNVRMELYNFPQNEFGFIEGNISSIFPVEIGGECTATVSLKNGKLITSKNKILPIQPIMKGEGEILINNKSIFSRIFGSIFSV